MRVKRDSQLIAAMSFSYERGDGGGGGREAAYCPMNIEDHALPRSANRKGDKLSYREHKPSGVGGL